MKKLHLGVFILTAAILVLLTGCGTIQHKVSEKVSEGIVEKAVGGKVDITKDGVKVQKDGTSIESGSDLKWPKSTLGDLPEPKAKIVEIINGAVTVGCTVVFSEMSLDEAKAYVDKLKDLGYKDGLIFSDNDGLSYAGKNSSGASAMITYNASPKEGTIGYIPPEANKGN
ncbi:MAG TPA: DUF6591 domain-containing protein [Desulfosporosinus sp.]